MAVYARQKKDLYLAVQMYCVAALYYMADHVIPVQSYNYVHCSVGEINSKFITSTAINNEAYLRRISIQCNLERLH